jgi:hypothetical protein
VSPRQIVRKGAFIRCGEGDAQQPLRG